VEKEIAELPADVPEGTATVEISKTLAKDVIAAIRRCPV
jgi:ferredoxin